MGWKRAYPKREAPARPETNGLESAFISALNDIRYNGCAVIEVEDKAFEGSREDILDSIRLSKHYLDNFLA